MTAAAHAIETLQWTSRGSADRERARAHQARLAAFLNGPGLRTIAEVFSRISPPGEVWQLDRLEIDTGPMTENGSFAQWSQALEHQLWETLWRARHAQGSLHGEGRPARTLSADQHALEHFLYYLRHGHLPWTQGALAGRALSAWLARLARRTGPRLWALLHQQQPGDYVRARLAQIAPYQGLQALLAVRHRELADSLDALDAQLLMPLQTKGRLSAYQVGQLQQAWRVAAFQSLWDQNGGNLGADGLQRLRREMGLALARQLGRGGLGGWQPSHKPTPRLGARAEFRQWMLQGVLDMVEGAPGDAVDTLANATVPPMAPRIGRASAVPPSGPGRPRREADDDGQRLRAVPQDNAPVDAEALRTWLRHARGRGASDLRMHGTARRRWPAKYPRQAWLAGPQRPVMWDVIRALAEAPQTSSDRSGAGSVTWTESLRQFALAALAGGASAGLGRPGGLSALQAWLADYSLRALLSGERAPRDARGWRQLWLRALADWRGERSIKPARRRGHARTLQGVGVGARADVAPRREVSPGGGDEAPAYDGRHVGRDARTYDRKHGRRHGARAVGIDGDAPASEDPPDRRKARMTRAATHDAATLASRRGLPPHAALYEGYLRAMRTLAAQSRAIPPSALRLRWRARLTRFAEARPDGLGVAHFAASRDAWRGELAGPAVMEGSRAGSIHKEVVAGARAVAPETAHDPQRQLVRWLAGAVGAGSAAQWAVLLRMPDHVAAVVLPTLRRRAWRAHVARHWSTARKLELLVLIAAARGREPVADWRPALERWQWLPQAIATAAAGADRARHDWRPTAWLWDRALQWAVDGGTPMVGSSELCQYWRRALAKTPDFARPALSSARPVDIRDALLARTGFTATFHGFQRRAGGLPTFSPRQAMPSATSESPQTHTSLPLARDEVGQTPGTRRAQRQSSHATVLAASRTRRGPNEASVVAGGRPTPPAPSAPLAPRAEATDSPSAWIANALVRLLPFLPTPARTALHGRLLTQVAMGTLPAWRPFARRYAQALRAARPARFGSTGAALQELAKALAAAPEAVHGGAGNRAFRRMPWLPDRQPRRHVNLSRVPARFSSPHFTTTGERNRGALAEPMPQPATRRVRMPWRPARPSVPLLPLASATRRRAAGRLAKASPRRAWHTRTRLAAGRARFDTLAARPLLAGNGSLRYGSAARRAAHARRQPHHIGAARANSRATRLNDDLLQAGEPVSRPWTARRGVMRPRRENRTAGTTRAAMFFRRWQARLVRVLAALARLRLPRVAFNVLPNSDRKAVRHAVPRRHANTLPGVAATADTSRPLSRRTVRSEPSAPEGGQMPVDLPDADADRHYIDNAGLVLLANYSQRLFEMLNLLDGPCLRDAAAQSRAVRCLAYLIDGHEDGSEPEWVLPKLLCGMPLAQPVLVDAGLGDDTRALLDSLLQAVIAHWKALGRTSPAGLRETFLRREGRLQREAPEAGAHWRLVVRPGPFDMLLDRLPWSYATIKLPWMREVLYVDWR